MNTSLKHRALAFLAGATMIVGLGAAAPTSTAAAATSAPSGTSERAVPACRAADMRASYRYFDGTAGTEYGYLRLKNVSDHACSTGGYGGISYVGYGDGTQIGAAADRDPGTVRTIVVQPGQRVRSVLARVNPENYSRARCRPRRVDGFRVYVPNETRSLYVPYRTNGCANPQVHLLHHKPYRR